MSHSQQQVLPLITKDLLQFYASKDSYECLPLARQFLASLSSKKIAVGAITNTDPRIKEVLSQHDLADHFVFILDAYTAGFAKPDPTIFSQAIQLSGMKGLQERDCLHIGDSLMKDFVAAKDVGWHAYLVAQDCDEQCQKHNVAPDSERMFTNLSDVINML